MEVIGHRPVAVSVDGQRVASLAEGDVVGGGGEVLALKGNDDDCPFFHMLQNFFIGKGHGEKLVSPNYTAIGALIEGWLS